MVASVPGPWRHFNGDVAARYNMFGGDPSVLCESINNSSKLRNHKLEKEIPEAEYFGCKGNNNDNNNDDNDYNE